MSRKPLTLTYDPATIDHMGLKMYSRLPAALAELVSNAYDADASNVKITLREGENDSERKIVIWDDGIGMSYDEVNDCFLRVSRNRRVEEGDAMKRTPKGRLPAGKKGLGKLAVFGIGKQIRIRTKKFSHNPVAFELSWDDILAQKNGSYFPNDTSDTVEHIKDAAGTEVTISNLKRKSRFDLQATAKGLARLFHCFDRDFEVSVCNGDDEQIKIDNNFKYEYDDKKVESVFNYKEHLLEKSKSDYAHAAEISGQIITTKSPIHSKDGRGVTLFARGRLVNLPSFFDMPDSSHFFAYVTGHLDVSFIDVDDGSNDYIATNRQSLAWEEEKPAELRKHLVKIVRAAHALWREARKQIDDDNFESRHKMTREQWLRTLPDDKREAVDTFLKSDVKNYTREKTEDFAITVMPEYAEHHWRYLHPKIRSNQYIEKAYRTKDYVKAVVEAIKIYKEHVIKVGRIGIKETNAKEVTLAKNDRRDIFNHLAHIQLFDFNEEDLLKAAKENLNSGYANFICGALRFRNVESHNSNALLMEKANKKLLTEADCLDHLSIISYLFNRLDRRFKP